MNQSVVDKFKTLMCQSVVYQIDADDAPEDGDEFYIPAYANRVDIDLGSYAETVALTFYLPPAPQEEFIMHITADASATVTITLKDYTGSYTLSTLTDGTFDTWVRGYCGEWARDVTTLDSQLTAVISAVGTYAGENDVVTDLATLVAAATAPDTQEITVDTTAAIQAPNYCLLTQINDGDSDGVTFTVAPPVTPHACRFWVCEVVAVGTSTVTVDVDTDVTGLTTGDLVFCYHDGDAWHAFRDITSVADLITGVAANTLALSAAATQTISEATATEQAPNYCRLTKIDDADNDGITIVVSPPVTPHTSCLWECHVVAVGTSTVTVNLETDVTGLGDGDRVLAYYNGAEWVYLADTHSHT